MPERFGQYTVYDELGVGGMASVHIAKDPNRPERVALKRLLPHTATDADTVKAFLDEARLVVRLEHPNIAATYDCGKVGDSYFIAMEYVPGHTLAQLIVQSARTIGVIPFPITVNILIQLCDALEYAHTLTDDKGKPLKIVHRDVSPANVILSSAGIVKLIDFGIAKATSSTVHSQAGVVKGKFRYMAPEYIAGKLDSRCDLWALGTVAYELLTNKRLFDGSDDFNILYNVKFQDIAPPSTSNAEVPKDFDVIVMTALQRDPAQRWQSAGAMRTALMNTAAELHTTVTNAQLIEWVDWTFSQQPPKKDSELSQLIELLHNPTHSRARVALNEVANSAVPAASVPEPEAAPPSPQRKKPAPAVPIRRPMAPVPERTHSPLRVLFLLLLLAAVAVAIWYYGYAPREVTDLLGIEPHG